MLLVIKNGHELTFGPVDPAHYAHRAIEEAALVAIAPVHYRFAGREEVAEWPAQLLQVFLSQIVFVKTPVEAGDATRTLVASTSGAAMMATW
nr:hypothetical protein [Bradyrhizobium sp. AS23.2]